MFTHFNLVVLLENIKKYVLHFMNGIIQINMYYILLMIYFKLIL